MLTIRLRRSGAKKDPHFRVVVTDSRAGRDGPFIEILGHYHPRRDPAVFTVDRERVDSWVGKGAQLSDTVRTLIRQLEAGKIREPERQRRPATKPEEAEGEEAGAAPEETVEDTREEEKAAEEPEEKAAAEEKDEESEAAEETAAEQEEEESEKDE